MRDESKRYEGQNFAAEKVVATLYLILFVVIVGVGAHAQLERLTVGTKSFAAAETSVR
jgi:hypothetical protein